MAARSCATAAREPSQGREAAALSGACGVPQIAWSSPPRAGTVSPWRSARAAESARLESVCGETHRGFESHLLRCPQARAFPSGKRLPFFVPPSEGECGSGFEPVAPRDEKVGQFFTSATWKRREPVRHPRSNGGPADPDPRAERRWPWSFGPTGCDHRGIWRRPAGEPRGVTVMRVAEPPNMSEYVGGNRR